MQQYEMAQKSADFISQYLKKTPETAVVLGSGLGGLADALKDAVQIPYGDIPHFPVSTVPGHDGQLIAGELSGKYILAMKGRFHYYEGYSMKEITYPVRVMQLLGVKNLIATNAAGGVNTAFSPGDLMLISDHIKLIYDSPLRGANDDRLGERFSDMSGAYSARLRKLAKAAAEQSGIDVKEGVYFYMAGPSFETPAEIRAIRALGADAVGMSTVPEVIAAAHAKMEVLGISCISNMAAGILPQPLTHAEVLKTGERVGKSFIGLLKAVIEKI